MLTVQLVVPATGLQPYQPPNVPPSAGVAVRVTTLPFASASVQSPAEPVVQAIPGPSTPPDPFTATRSVYVAGWNVAVIVRATVIVTVQVAPDGVGQPDHDLKIASGPGVAVSVTVAPFATGALHVPAPPVAREIPAPSTVPFPESVALSV